MEGVGYGDEKMKKVIIFLMDGDNVWFGWNNYNRFFFLVYGFIVDEFLGIIFNG